MAKGKKKGAGSRSGSGANDSGMVIYRGPIVRRSQQPQEFRIPLRQTFAIASSAAGYVELYLNTTNAAQCSEWAGIAPLWREYRVLGLRFEYVSSYDKGGANRTGYPGAIAAYHGAPPAWQQAVTSSSFNNTWLMEGAQPFHPCENKTMEWRMSDIEEAQFFSTSTSYNSGGIYAITGGTVSASANFGVLFTTVLIEFKGRV